MQTAVLLWQVVCPSLTLKYRGHTGWNFWKICTKLAVAGEIKSVGADKQVGRPVLDADEQHNSGLRSISDSDDAVSDTTLQMICGGSWVDRNHRSVWLCFF